MTNIESVSEFSAETPEQGGTGLLDEVLAGMTARAKRYGAMYNRPDADDVSVLMEELDERGLTLEDFTPEQINQLDNLEGDLEHRYLKDDENDDEE